MNFFSVPIHLRIDKQYNHSSRLGELLSIAIIVYILLIVIESDYFYKQNPKVVSQTMQLPETETMIFNSKNFSIAVKLSDASSKGVIDPQSFKFQAIFSRLVDYNDGKGQIIVSQNITDMILCTKSHFEYDVNNFNLYGFQNAYCLNQSFFEIGGFWDESHVYFMKIQLVLCTNDTKNPNAPICKDIETIKEIITYKFFGIYMTNHEIDVNNYENPVKSLIHNYYMLVDSKIRKRWNFKMREVNLETNDGYLWPQTKTIKTYKHGEMSFDFDISYADKIVFEFLMYGDKKKDIFDRKYVTFQELIANLGGISQFLINLGFVVFSFFLKKDMNEVISNHLYRFRFTKDRPKKRKKSVRKDNLNLLSNMESKIIEKKIIEPLQIQQNVVTDTIKNSTIIQQNVVIDTIKNSTIEIQKFIENDNQIKEEDLFKSIKKSKFMEIDYKNKKKKYSIKTIHEKPPLLTPQIKENKGDLMNVNFESNIEINQNSIEKNIVENKINSEIKNPENNTAMNRSEKKSDNIQIVKNNNIITKRKETLVDNFKVYQGMKHKENSIFTNIFDYFKIAIFNKNKTEYLREKQKLLRMSNKEINDQLDIITILKKLQEIDKLKSILLTKQQINLFNLLSKPLISLENNPGNINYSQNIDNNTLKDTVEYYKNSRNSDPSSIDYKLHLLVDEDMKIFLEF